MTREDELKALLFEMKKKVEEYANEVRTGLSLMTAPELAEYWRTQIVVNKACRASYTGGRMRERHGL